VKQPKEFNKFNKQKNHFHILVVILLLQSKQEIYVKLIPLMEWVIEKYLNVFHCKYSMENNRII
jgi:hypothetical protein